MDTFVIKYALENRQTKCFGDVSDEIIRPRPVGRTRYSRVRRDWKSRKEINLPDLNNPVRMLKLSESYLSWRRELDEMSELGDNWDEEGGYSIDANVLNCLRDMLPMLPSSVLDRWAPMPVANGTVWLEAVSDVRGSVSIGKDGFNVLIKTRNNYVKKSIDVLDANAGAAMLIQLTGKYLLK